MLRGRGDVATAGSLTKPNHVLQDEPPKDRESEILRYAQVCSSYVFFFFYRHVCTNIILDVYFTLYYYKRMSTCRHRWSSVRAPSPYAKSKNKFYRRFVYSVCTPNFNTLLYTSPNAPKLFSPRRRRLSTFVGECDAITTTTTIVDFQMEHARL